MRKHLKAFLYGSAIWASAIVVITVFYGITCGFTWIVEHWDIAKHYLAGIIAIAICYGTGRWCMYDVNEW